MRNRINYIPKRQTLSNIDITTATDLTYYRKIFRGAINETAIKFSDVNNVSIVQCVFLDYTASSTDSTGRAIDIGGTISTQRTIQNINIERCFFLRCRGAVRIGYADCEDVTIDRNVCIDTIGYLFNGVLGNWRGGFFTGDNIDVNQDKLVTISNTIFWNRTGQNHDINALVSVNRINPNSGWLEILNGWYKQELGATYTNSVYGSALSTGGDDGGKRQRIIGNRGLNQSAFGIQLEYAAGTTELEIKDNYILIEQRNVNGESGTGFQVEVWDDYTINNVTENIIYCTGNSGSPTPTFFDTGQPNYTPAKAGQLRKNNNFIINKLNTGLLPEKLIL
jgi:hypothetical protein